MENEKSSGKRKQERRKDEDQIRDRLQGLYADQGSLPASLSIRQAEELLARVRALEAELSGQTAAKAEGVQAPQEAAVAAPPEAAAEAPQEAPAGEPATAEAAAVEVAAPATLARQPKPFSLGDLKPSGLLSRAGSRLGGTRLGTRLILTILVFTILSIAIFGYNTFARAFQSSDYLTAQLDQSVRQQAEVVLESAGTRQADTLNNFFAALRKDATDLAATAQELLDNQEALNTGAYWNALESVTQLPNGAWDNPNTDTVSIHIPGGTELTEERLSLLNTMVQLNFQAPTLLESNPDIVAVYFGAETGETFYYPNIDLANIVGADFDVTGRPWYVAAKPANNLTRTPVWSAPYLDAALNGLVITTSAPVYDSLSVFHGVAAMDIQLVKVSEIVSAIRVGETGHAFLVDSEGRLIAMSAGAYADLGVDAESYPLGSVIGTPAVTLQNSPELINVLERMMAGGSGLETIGINGVDNFIIYRPVPEVGYNLAIVVPTEELLAVTAEAQAEIAGFTRNTVWTSIGIILGVLLITLVGGLFIGRRMTRPLEELTRAAEDISHGNLDARAAVQSRDEIGLLATTFNSMTSQLRSMIGGLEQRVADRTHDLELATEVGRTITEKVADQKDMLTSAVDLIRNRFNLYYTQIYLLDPNGKTLILEAGTGDVGKLLLDRNHRLPVSYASLNGRAVLEKQAIIVEDTSATRTFLPNPLLPNTRSEMAIPLSAGGQVLGVLDMQSEIPGTLNPGNLAAFETLAGQLSVAVQNAGLLAQAEQARSEVEASLHDRTISGWQEFMNSIDTSARVGYLFDQNATVPVQEPVVALEDEAVLNKPITVTGIEVGVIQAVGMEARLKAREGEIISATATRLGQHIENLRLLAQAERYRQEAEEAVRRLTREGWEAYTRVRQEMGYRFDLNEVQPVGGEETPAGTVALDLAIGEESIGHLAVDASAVTPESMEVLESVATQLSGHLENLRLLEQAERQSMEVQQAQIRLRTLIENAPEAIVVVDLTSGQFREPNENAVRLYKLSREELVKVGPAEMSPPTQPDGRPSMEKAMERINEALQGGTPVFEWVHRNSLGEDIPCEVSLVNLPGDRPQVRASVIDITERKRTQEIIARRALQLETVAQVSVTTSTVLDPDRLLQTIVDLTRERFGVYHAHIYLANEQWQTLLLSAGAGEVGRQMVAEEHTIPMDAERSLVARAARARSAIIVNDVRADPGFLPNPLLPETRSEMAVPMLVGDRVLGVFDVQSEDVNGFSGEDASIYTTLAGQVAVALQNARLYVEQAATVTQLRELDRLKSSFLANMSHELRTPLNSILGFSDVIIEGIDGPLTENMSKDIQLIQKNGQHLLHLINDVLDMAKIEAGKMNLSVEKFNLHDIITDVTSITAPFANERSIALIVDDSGGNEVDVIADRTRIRQVVLNVVNNAIKFTNEGSVTIRASRQDENVLVSVKDTGIGVSEDKLEVIFQEFTQVDTSTTRKAGGTGLGLPISRRLVEMHGGKLWAESSGVPGEGTTFFILLPLEAQVREADQEVGS